MLNYYDTFNDKQRMACNKQRMAYDCDCLPGRTIDKYECFLIKQQAI